MPRTYTAAAAAYTQQEARILRDKSHEDVRITQSNARFVKPALPLQNHWYPLSNMDRLMPSVYEQSYFVYNSTKGRAFGDVVASLERSLSQVLVPYYPLAGRLLEPDQGIYKVLCDGTGAEFAQAHADCDLEDLDYHQPDPALGRMLAPTKLLPAEDASLPPLCVQITRFRCGGVIVGCSFHHQVVDVHSGNMFLKAWSQVMRSEPLTSLPYHGRWLLQPRMPARATLDHSLEYKVKPRELSRVPRTPPQEQPWPIVHRIFHLDSSALQKLKASSAEASGEAFTSTQCTSAYLWRLIARANGFEGHGETRLVLSVDGRKRVQNPQLPEGFFGNMIANASVVCPAREVVGEPLGRVAARVRASIARTATDENFRSLVDLVEANKGSTIMPNFDVFKDRVVIASSCIHLGLYEIDFGWGRPQFAGFAAIPEGISNFVILLPSPLGYGNMNVSLRLRADHLANLEKDPDFRPLASANESGAHGQQHLSLRSSFR